MIRAAALMALLASPALAEHPASLQIGTRKDADRIWLEREAADRYRLHYHNSIRQTSKNGTHTLQLGQMVVVVVVEIISDEAGRERVMAHPPADLIAVPPEAYARDGETASILIIKPMF